MLHILDLSALQCIFQEAKDGVKTCFRREMSKIYLIQVEAGPGPRLQDHSDFN